MMPFFRKKPVVIEARRLGEDFQHEVADWCHGKLLGVLLPPGSRAILISTLEGEMRAEIGDYIIKGIQGEFYPCKPDIFQATYEQVES
jgi:hypothetical protein